ncbi:MAG: DUF2157 domain-containing protein [Hyphomicrobium sp.]|nr:DUF2157 domain-containing protein [Hyphomicrobium sp.]PPD06387.1 MAG: hypothetical protein CTY28_14095 [Hyphomicrobium sp.]
MWGYQQKVAKDLERWRAAGWIDEAGARAIRADVASRGRGIGLPGALAILAAVLIGFAVMSFVAANWQDMSRVFRLGLLTGLLCAAYVLAAAMFRRGLDTFGHAAVLAGCAIFGADIMLVSQMYHMDGNAPDVVLVWAAGTLLAGALIRSNPALAFALVLFSVWGLWETGQRDAVYWPYLVPWALVSAAFYWQRWEPGVHLSGLALTGFILTYGQIHHAVGGFETVTLIGVVIGALSALGLVLRPGLAAVWRGGILYGFFITFSGLFALQFFKNPSLSAFLVLAVLALALTLAAVWWGLTADDRRALWLGYLGFSLQILWIYGKTVGSLMGSSVFFLSAGFVVAGLAYFAYRLHARREAQEVVS